MIVKSFQDLKKHFDAENAHKVLALLQEKGVSAVEVIYSGYGDSGGIEDITYSPFDVSLSPEEERQLKWFCENIIDSEFEGYENDEGGIGTLYLACSKGQWDTEETRIEHEWRQQGQEAESFPVPLSILEGDEAKALLAYMIENNLEAAEIDYAGYGDDGNIEEIFLDEEEVSDPKIKELMIALGWEIIEAEVSGFENNEGGQGTIHLVRKGTGWDADRCLVDHVWFYEDYV